VNARVGTPDGVNQSKKPSHRVSGMFAVRARSAAGEDVPWLLGIDVLNLSLAWGASIAALTSRRGAKKRSCADVGVRSLGRSLPTSPSRRLTTLNSRASYGGLPPLPTRALLTGGLPAGRSRLGPAIDDLIRPL
jgi:hypothetical protein